MNSAFTQNKNIKTTKQDLKKKNLEYKDKKEPCDKCPKCPDPIKIVLDNLEKRKEKLVRAEKDFLFEKKKFNRIKLQIDEDLEKLMTLQKQVDSDLAILKINKQNDLQKKVDELSNIIRETIINNP